MNENNRVRLGIIVRDFKMGGVQRFISHLTSKLNKKKFQIFLNIIDNREIDALSIIQLDDCFSIRINPYNRNNPLTIFWLKSQMKRMDVNISFILRADVTAGICAKLFNIKNLIITERGGRLNRLAKNPIKKIMFLIDKFIVFKICKGAISNSVLGKQALVENGLNPKKINIISNGIVCDSQNQEEIIKNDNYTNVGFLGRLEKFKNVQVLIEAFKKLDSKKYRLIIGGYGSEKSNLINLVKQYQIDDKVNFVGFVSDLDKYYNSIDIAVLPSDENGTESFPNVLLEYWKYNKPVIMSDIKAIRDIAYGMKHAVYFDPKDENDLSKKIEIMANNYRLRKSNVNESRILLKKKYNIDNIIKQYEKYFTN